MRRTRERRDDVGVPVQVHAVGDVGAVVGSTITGVVVDDNVVTTDVAAQQHRRNGRRHGGRRRTGWRRADGHRGRGLRGLPLAAAGCRSGRGAEAEHSDGRNNGRQHDGDDAAPRSWVRVGGQDGPLSVKSTRRSRTYIASSVAHDIY